MPESLPEQGTNPPPCPPGAARPWPLASPGATLAARVPGSRRHPRGEGETRVCRQPPLPRSCLYLTSRIPSAWAQRPPRKPDTAAPRHLRPKRGRPAPAQNLAQPSCHPPRTPGRGHGEGRAPAMARDGLLPDVWAGGGQWPRVPAANCIGHGSRQQTALHALGSETSPRYLQSCSLCPSLPRFPIYSSAFTVSPIDRSTRSRRRGKGSVAVNWRRRGRQNPARRSLLLSDSGWPWPRQGGGDVWSLSLGFGQLRGTAHTRLLSRASPAQHPSRKHP